MCLTCGPLEVPDVDFSALVPFSAVDGGFTSQISYTKGLHTQCGTLFRNSVRQWVNIFRIIILFVYSNSI